MSENIRTLQNLLDCEIIPFPQSTTPEQVMAQYLRCREEGNKEKFTPVIVTVSDMLLEKFELDLEEEDLPFTKEGMQMLRQRILEKASELNGADFYKEEKEELKEEIDTDELHLEADEEEDLMFSSFLQLSKEDEDEVLEENVVMLKIPTDKPYEVLAWLPIGGFNDCPLPEEMVAMAKYWFEKHSAEPAALTYDVAEFYLPEPVSDKETLVELALEQYIFDVDIVEQGVGDVESLIETLYMSRQWYFWWD